MRSGWLTSADCDSSTSGQRGRAPTSRSSDQVKLFSSAEAAEELADGKDDEASSDDP